MSVQLAYADALIIGLEYADCDQEGRKDLGSWLRVPLKRLTIQAYLRARRVDDVLDLFDPDELMTALSARARLTRPFHLELVLARDWFVDVDAGGYLPSTSALLMFEASWGSGD